ncbi:MAG: NADH dehydrogenase [Burkholderiaceae bacterium]|jgi:NADH dehydrogenase|nr:MAG: NADH dehydrogenase [Burkholderiaceae bacterium]
MKRILVLGAGFAGLWSAVGAARQIDALGTAAKDIEVLVVNRDAWHGIRVRNYEPDLSDVRVALAGVLDPIGVAHIEAEVTGIDARARKVSIDAQGGASTLDYDRLVFALGSGMVAPALPGFAQHAFDVDTYAGAMRLNRHIDALPALPHAPGQYTALVIGSGLTGIEAATELVGKLHAAAERGGAPAGAVRVILAEHADHIGSNMGEQAGKVIAEALAAQRIATRTGVRIVSVTADGVRLEDGETIAAATVVCCTGMRASPLAEQLGVPLDRFGRVAIDEVLRVEGVPGVFAAGDVAAAMVDVGHASVMSCQHARPMGRFAGHNVVCDLLGHTMLPMHIAWYTTILDLGAAGACYTEGWDRHVVATGDAAKKTKRIINRERIYPPRGGNRAQILAAAAPVIQAPPQRFA